MKTLSINTRLDARTVAQLATFFTSKSIPLQSAAGLIYNSIEFIGDQLEKTNFPRPTTQTEAMKILSGIISNNMKTRELLKQLSSEDIQLELDLDTDDDIMSEINNTTFEEALKQIKKEGE